MSRIGEQQLTIYGHVSWVCNATLCQKVVKTSAGDVANFDALSFTVIWTFSLAYIRIIDEIYFLLKHIENGELY